jgi:hypothetical protein
MFEARSALTIDPLNLELLVESEVLVILAHQ